MIKRLLFAANPPPAKEIAMFAAEDGPHSQPKPVSQELLEADLGRKIFAATAVAIVIGAVVVAFRKPFGDGRHGEYIFVGVGALIAFGKIAFESLRHHLRWRRLRRTASSSPRCILRTNLLQWLRRVGRVV